MHVEFKKESCDLIKKIKEGFPGKAGHHGKFRNFSY